MPNILTFYNPSAPTMISVDAPMMLRQPQGVLEVGHLGAVQLQVSDSMWHPVSYASTDTKTHCTQIEKEALALTWACGKLSYYILEKHIVLEANHTPLVPKLSYKHLGNLPPWVLRFRLRLMRFDYDITLFVYLVNAFILQICYSGQNPPDEHTLAQQADVEHFF